MHATRSAEHRGCPSFVRSYVKDANLVVDKRKITRKYASRWLWVDLLGSIPWETILLVVAAAGVNSDGFGSMDMVSIVKLLKMPKMLRLGRLFKQLEKIEGAANVGRIIILMLLMTLIVHWQAPPRPTHSPSLIATVASPSW